MCAWHGPQARPARCRSGRALGVDGDDLPAAAPDQKHPVEPLSQDLEELHVVLVSLAVSGGAGHVEQHQLGVLGLAQDDPVQLHGRVHSPDIRLVRLQAEEIFEPGYADVFVLILVGDQLLLRPGHLHLVRRGRGLGPGSHHRMGRGVPVVD